MDVSHPSDLRYLLTRFLPFSPNRAFLSSSHGSASLIVPPTFAKANPLPFVFEEKGNHHMSAEELV